MEDSTKEYLTASSGERGFGLPSPRRHGMGAPPTPITTTPWMENTPPTQDMTTVPSWMAALWPDTSIPFEKCRACQGRQQAHDHAQ
jgi:hypothetical protein